MIQTDKYRLLEDGRVLVDYGPITMLIAARKWDKWDINSALIGAEKVIKAFDELIEYLEVAKLRINEIDMSNFSSYPEVLKLMIEAFF